MTPSMAVLSHRDVLLKQSVSFCDSSAVARGALKFELVGVAFVCACNRSEEGKRSPSGSSPLILISRAHRPVEAGVYSGPPSVRSWATETNEVVSRPGLPASSDRVALPRRQGFVAVDTPPIRLGRPDTWREQR